MPPRGGPEEGHAVTEESNFKMTVGRKPPAWRIVWQERLPTGRYVQHQAVEYAETQARAANAALAKIRRSCPKGELLACDILLI
jgi:hypothetical protein